MKNPKLNIQTKSLEQNPKQPDLARFILNVVLFLIRIAYLYSVHHVFSENLEYVEHFFGIHHYIMTPLVDMLMVTHEFFPNIFANSYVAKFITKFPKYNLVIYVLFSLLSFATCPASCFWTCFITVSEELIIGYVFHKLLHDRQHDYKNTIAMYNKVVSFIKNLKS